MSAPVNFSNNAIPLKDLLKKEIVIDLKKIATGMPQEGLTLNTSAYPLYGMHLNIGNVFIGASAGLDAYGQLGISKDIFDFIGNGNRIGETINVELNDYIDVFVHSDFDFGLKLNKYGIHIAPSLFLPIISATGDTARASFVNDEDGNIVVSANADFKVHSIIDINNMDSMSQLNVSDGLGFDLGFQYEYFLSKRATLGFDARIPIVPGKLAYETGVGFSMNYNMNIFDMENATNSSDIINGDTVRKLYYVNRPMKLTGYVDYKLMGSLLSTKLGGGLGVYHPFVDNTKFYPEYYIGATLNIFYILKLGLSTEYTDRVFKHQTSFTFNTRILQLDVGTSLQSTSFTKSFTGSGYGAFVMFTVGF